MKLKLLLAVFTLVAAASPAFAQGHVGGAIPVAPAAPVAAHFASPMNFAPTASPVSSPVFSVQTTTLLLHDQPFPKDLIDPLLPRLIKDKREFNSKGIKIERGLGYNGGSGILFHEEEGSKIAQLSPNELKLDEGSVLLSVHGQTATVETPNGKVQVKGEGNVLTSFIAGVMRVDNISARAGSCRVLMNGATIERDTTTVALAPAYELVVGDRKLADGEIRPADGIARRRGYVFEGARVATNEFSIDSIIDSHPIISSMLNDTSRQDRKCLNEVTKMAAVMNYVHGAGGYKQAEGVGIATRPGRNTQ
jgi:hypothetical protein